MCLAVVAHGQGAVLLLVQVGLVAAQGGSRQQGVSAGCTVGPPGECVMCVMLCHVVSCCVMSLATHLSVLTILMATRLEVAGERDRELTNRELPWCICLYKL